MRVNKWLSGLTLLMAFVSQAGILMDYEGDGLRNGGFEASVKNPAKEVQALFDAVDGWDNVDASYQRRTNQATEAAKSDDLSQDGGLWAAVIGYDRIFAQSLGHTIQSGDQFSASFMWRGALRWKESSELIMTLYYYDDSVAKTVSSWSYNNKTASSSWTGERMQSGALDLSDAIGKELWVRFESKYAPGTKNRYKGFARFDNIRIEAVPEPATIGLVGLCGGLLFWTRRRERR